MVDEHVTDAELEAFLDEALRAAEMSRLEQRLRDDEPLARRLAEIVRRRDAGRHSLGSIWRRYRIGCPTRDDLGAYLLGTLDEDHARHVQFHLDAIGCRVCLANVADLAELQRESADPPTARRRKLFESSAGFLHKKK